LPDFEEEYKDKYLVKHSKIVKKNEINKLEHRDSDREDPKYDLINP